MAFSATVRGTGYLFAPLRVTYGDWTGSAGDAAGTITISGVVQNAVFQKFDAIDGTYQIIPRIEVSISGFTSTVTVENQDTVTSGKFMIWSLGA